MPNYRRHSQQREAPARKTPSCHLHSAPHRLVRAHAVGPLLGPHAYTTRARKTLAAGGGRAPDTRRPSPQ